MWRLPFLVPGVMGKSGLGLLKEGEGQCGASSDWKATAHFTPVRQRFIALKAFDLFALFRLFDATFVPFSRTFFLFLFPS